MGKRKKGRLRFRRRTPPGSQPGKLVSDPEAPPPALHVICFGPDGLVEEQDPALERVRELRQQNAVTWLNVIGVGDARTVQNVGKLFDLHSLALEDVVHVHQRPKAEDYEHHTFLVLRMIRNGSEHISSEQVALFLGDKFVVSFQERSGDVFDPVRQRLRQSSGRTRQRGPDYLVYSLLDAVIDNYFPVLETYGERLDKIEEEVLSGNDEDVMSRLHSLRSELLWMRRAAWPLRDVLNELGRDDVERFSPDTRLYLRDCYDHIVQVLDLLEVCRELCAEVRDLHMEAVNQRQTEVMKVLTVIATIFIPLSFIAGVYGMNFDTDSPWNMPELGWRFGYQFALALMAAVAGGQLFFFWRRGWLKR